MSSPSNYFVHPLLRARDWQHRPQFDQVCDWWRNGGQGVCALVGMGGAGKTAIAERFLNDLPNVMPAAASTGEATPIDPLLPQPPSVFVYSFYDDDKPENFFRRLQIWLEGSPRLETVLSVGQIMFLVQQRQGLIILDGLEKVQDSGARGGFGKLTSPSLRDLLNHIACGSARELSVLVTSRFPLADLRDSQPRFFHMIAVEGIDVAAGVGLLRDRGVRGTDMELEPIIEHCGRHALTVDFAGGYIKEYGDGDPTTPLNLGTAEELLAEAEQEPDDDKRAVLKQGFRFARIAQRYRDAMISSDEAAIALLERICLFRLGVDCETLAAIFTGPAAEKVSGKALASLDADQLQKKLDWLVRMRIVERSQSSSSLSTLDSGLSTLYSIHPAVRDDFLRGIGRDAAQASHEAVRQGLEVSLGDAPGENPCDPATLDLLEEIVHHTLQSGRVREAWDIYKHRIGGIQNLLWRLGTFERGLRLCRMFDELEASLRNLLSAETQTELDRQCSMYLLESGRLTECYSRLQSLLERALKHTGATVYLSQVLCLQGRLRRSRETVDIAVEKEQSATGTDAKIFSFAFRGCLNSIMGHLESISSDFETALSAQNMQVALRAMLVKRDEILESLPGVWRSSAAIRVGNFRVANLLVDANERRYADFNVRPRWNLLKAELLVCDGELSEAQSWNDKSWSYATEREAKEILCWSALVEARIKLPAISGQQSTPEDERVDHLAAAGASITQGLKIARDCGFGLYHIDLLLERARLHLLRGDPGAALEDIELALDTGIPANDETGQPELLAANHEECGYAWAIPAGLQLRAEALLLRVAQTLRQDSYVPGKMSEMLADVLQLIDQAKQHLHDALDRWHELRDPEPTEDNNFQLDGKEYNYRAAETHQVLVQLEGGMLTRYPLELIEAVATETEPEPLTQSKPIEESMSKRFNVALSFPGEHRSTVEEIARSLSRSLTREKVFYDRFWESELARPNLDTYLQNIYHNDSDLVVVFLCAEYDTKEWCGLEFRAIRNLIKKRRDDEIMFIRVDDGDVKGVFEIDGCLDAKGRPALDVAQAIRDRLQAVQDQ